MKNREVFDIIFIQSIQDFFAKTLDVALVCVRNNEWLTQSSNTIEFCSQYIRTSHLGYKKCDFCHQKMEKEAIEKGKPVQYRCHAGLSNFVIPIIVEDEYLACVLGGQFLEEVPNEHEFKQIAKKCGVDVDSFWEGIKNVKVIPPDKVKSIIDLLYFITNSIAMVACTNRKLADLGLDCHIPKNVKLEEWLFANYGIQKRPITGREFEILKLMVLGKNNNEIAKDLFISVHTVKSHVSSIIEKFEVEDRVQVAVKAVREGLV